MALLEVGWEHGPVCVISDFRLEVAAGIGNFLPTFRDNTSVALYGPSGSI